MACPKQESALLLVVITFTTMITSTTSLFSLGTSNPIAHTSTRSRPLTISSPAKCTVLEPQASGLNDGAVAEPGTA